MGIHSWQPGQRITAARLKDGLLAGNAEVVFPGAANVTSSFFNANYYRASVMIDFPEGFFTTTPFIIVAGRSSTPGTLLEVTYTGQSSSGFELVAARATSTTTVCDWIAIEL